jgi:hypothetical protein
MTASVARFSVRALNRLRQRAQQEALPPLDGADGWSVSPVDPMRVLAVFDTLGIRAGYVLRGYQYRAGDNGNGIVWAMPASDSLPPPAACARMPAHFLDAPRPSSALDDVMLAIEGDGSPYSYLCASVLARELAEFGARWHGISWGAERILGRRPSHAPSRTVGSLGERAPYWTWRRPLPARWSPQVTVTPERVAVTFYVLRIVGSECITRITDSFHVGAYTFTTDEEEVGIGGAGIIF